MRRGTASFALQNKAPVSASVADDKTARMMEQCTCTAPFKGEVFRVGRGDCKERAGLVAAVAAVGALPRKNNPPARERAFFSDK